MNEFHPPGIPPVPDTNAYGVSPAMMLPPGGELLRPEEKTMGMLCHLIALIGLVVPLGGIFGPLVVWLTQRNKSEFADYHGKEALNFNITMALLVLCGSILLGMLALLVLLTAFPLLFILAFIAAPVMLAVYVFTIVMSIIGAVKASDGIRYRYPLTIRFIR